MLRGRSNLLLSSLLLLGLPPVSSAYAERQRRIEALIHGALKWLPPDQQAAARPLLQADVRASSDPGAPWVEEEAAQALAEAVERWANTGAPVIVRDEPAGHGPWRARVRFLGPGSYSAEVYSVVGWTSRDVSMQVPLATHAAAWAAAVEAARRLQLAADAARASAMGIPPSEVKAAARDAIEPPSDTLTLAKMREAVAELERNAIPPRADGFYHLDDIAPRRVGIDPAETDFQRAQRMAMNTSADRAFASMRELGERVGKAAEHATRAVRDIAGKMRSLDLPRYSTKPRPKVARDPEVKRERKAGKAARAAAKKRRGWA
jgi:hypothetical protein